MSEAKKRFSGLPVAMALVLGGLSLSACATKGELKDKIHYVNHRIDAVDAKANEANQKADAAGAAAQQAMAAAQQANQRLDQLSPRVDALEQKCRQGCAGKPTRN